MMYLRKSGLEPRSTKKILGPRQKTFEGNKALSGIKKERRTIC